MIEESYKLAVKNILRVHRGNVHHAYQFLIIRKERDYTLDFTSFESVPFGKKSTYIHIENGDLFSGIRFIKKILNDFLKIKHVSTELFFDKQNLKSIFNATCKISGKKPKKDEKLTRFIHFFIEIINGRTIDDVNFVELCYRILETEEKVARLILQLNDMLTFIEENEIAVKQRDIDYVNISEVEKNVKTHLLQSVEAYNQLYPVVKVVEEVILDEDKVLAVQSYQEKAINNLLITKKIGKEEYISIEGFDTVYDIYTDASLNQNNKCAGYGVVLTDAHKKEVLGKMAGAFSMNVLDKGAIQLAEMRAIFEIIKHLNQNEESKNNCLINIYSDSMDSIGYLKSNLKNYAWKGNFKLIYKMINSIKEMKLNINFHFVKGHNGHKFNTLADQIAGWSAKKGLNKGLRDKLMNVDINNESAKLDFKVLM